MERGVLGIDLAGGLRARVYIVAVHHGVRGLSVSNEFLRRRRHRRGNRFRGLSCASLGAPLKAKPIHLFLSLPRTVYTKLLYYVSQNVYECFY